MKTNKKFKDTLFRHLFNTEEKLLELFNAIFGTDYNDISAIIINTLENVLFNGMKNDISFIIYDILVLIEHQSTINENMPLRMYHYLNYLYEKINSGSPNAIFGRDLIELPNPVFIVLYNGVEDYPAEKILNINTAFKKKKLKENFVDLEVKVININKGRNPELERKCKTLADYASLIAKVREYQKNHTLEEAIRLAVKYCIDNNILKEYLEQHASEAINMLTAEFDLDQALEVARWEGMKKGRIEGMEEGRVEGMEKGMEKGKQEIIDLLKSGKSPEEILKDYDEIQ